MEQLVITGIGLETGLGADPALFWEGLIGGKSAITESGLDYAPFTAPLRGFQAAGRFDRSVEIGLACMERAMKDAGEGFEAGCRTGLFFSSTKGGMHSVSRGLSDIYADCPARIAARKWGISATVQNIVAACATGIYALAAAARAIRAGECGNAVVGCTESALTPLILAGFGSMGALTRRGMAPFRKGRDGFAPAEGAAVFVIEEQAHAKARHARIYGRLAGFGLTTSTHHPIRFHPSGEGIVEAISLALKNAGIVADQIDAVCLHGTATLNNDLSEAAAVSAVFGPRVPCFGLKPSLGHLLGACAAVEAAVCLLAMDRQVIPPTLGTGPADPACRDIAISDRPLRARLERVLSLNFGFGGHIGALVLEGVP